MHHRHIHLKKFIEYAFALCFIIFTFYIGGRIGYGPMLEFIKSNFVLGIVVYFIYSIISNVVIFLPLVPLMPIVYYLYGIEIALIVTLSGTLIGASICFFLAKSFGKNLVIKLMGKRLFSEVEHLSEFDTPGRFFLIRLLGNNYYDLISYIAGLSKISYKYYLLTTTIATIIWTCILFFMIEKTGGVENINSFFALLAVYGGLVIFGTLVWEIYHRKHLKK